MPLTAPTSTSTRRDLSVRYIDDSGDRYSEKYVVASGVTDTEIRDFIAALGAATQANLYSWTLETVYAAAANAGAALDGEQNSVKDLILITFVNPTINVSRRVTIPAPYESIMEDDTDNVDNDDPLYEAVRNNAALIMGSGWSATTVTFTERRERNRRTPAS